MRDPVISTPIVPHRGGVNGGVLLRYEIYTEIEFCPFLAWPINDSVEQSLDQCTKVNISALETF